jgi:hypothetical protein
MLNATQLIDALNAFVEAHGNGPVLIDTEDGFALDLDGGVAMESFQSNPLAFVLSPVSQGEPHQIAPLGWDKDR